MSGAIINYYRENPGLFLVTLRDHFFLFVISWALAVSIGILLGIFSTRSGWERQGRIIIAASGALQAIPSLAVIALGYIFLYKIFNPVILALTVYSLAPVIFNTSSGFLTVSPKVIEAARGMGLSPLQVLFKVEMPLAMPAIMTGVRSAATINIGTVAIAYVVGAGGFGEIINRGLAVHRNHIILGGALPVALSAITVDFLLALLQRVLVPRGLRVK